jgi:internalin A
MRAQGLKEGAGDPMEHMPRCTNVQFLTIIGLPGISVLRNVPFLPRLHTLRIYACDLQDLVGLGRMPNLHTLDLELNLNMSDMSEIGAHTGIRRLGINWCITADVAPIAACTQLEHLCMKWANTQQGLDVVAQCTRLQTLQFWGYSTDISVVGNCKHLRILDLSWQGTDVAVLPTLTALERLKLHSENLEDIKPLAHMTQLKRIDLVRCHRKLTDITPLSECKLLEHIELDRCTGITDVSPLSECKLLEHLDLESCTGITDLTPLRGCPMLQHLNLQKCTHVTDIMPLRECSQLKHLNIHGSNVTAEQVTALATANTKLNVQTTYTYVEYT